MRVFLVSLLLLGLSGCASNVVTDYDSGAAFGHYGSWAFAPNGEGRGFTSLDGGRIESAVEREMDRKALRKMEDNEADLLVSWEIVEEERLERSGLGLGFGFGSGNFGWGLSSAPPVREIQEGKLVLELVDTDTDRVVWRAASRRYLNENQSSESRRKLIDEIVTDMFEEYPPGV